MSTTITENNDKLSESLNILEKRLQKIEEAQNFLEDISDRLFWALDFGDCPESVEPLTKVVTEVSNSQEKLEQEYDKLEEILNQFQKKREENLSELNQELVQELAAI